VSSDDYESPGFGPGGATDSAGEASGSDGTGADTAVVGAATFACEAYIVAANACTSTYGEAMGIDTSTLLADDSVCDMVNGQDAAMADYFACLEALYTDADCSETMPAPDVCTAPE
jgi:hypothetical protein